MHFSLDFILLDNIYYGITIFIYFLYYHNFYYRITIKIKKVPIKNKKTKKELKKYIH